MTSMHGMSTPAEMEPLMIREYFTDKRSISSRVVLDKITPPSPEPAFARPWRVYMSLR